MTRTLLTVLTVAGLAGLSNTADAAVGFTATQGATHTAKGSYYSPFFSMPTIDYLNEGLIFHFDVLSLLEGVAMGEGASQARLGVDIYKTTSKGDITPTIKGVVQPGGGIEVKSGPDFDFEYGTIGVTGQCRIGAQGADKMGFGMYVVPRLGVAYTPDLAGDKGLELLVGGGVQISAWIK